MMVKIRTPRIKIINYLTYRISVVDSDKILKARKYETIASHESRIKVKLSALSDEQLHNLAHKFGFYRTE